MYEYEEKIIYRSAETIKEADRLLAGAVAAHLMAGWETVGWVFSKPGSSANNLFTSGQKLRRRKAHGKNQ